MKTKIYYQFDVLDNKTYYQGMLEEETDDTYILSDVSRYTVGKNVGTVVTTKGENYSLLKDKIVTYNSIDKKLFSV